MIEIGTAGQIEGTGADVLLVGAGSDGTFDTGGAWVLEQVSWARERLEQEDFTGKADQLVTIDTAPPGYRAVVVVGLGDSPSAESVRRAAGSAARAVKGSRSIATTIHGWAPNGAGAVASGMVLGSYTFDRHKSDPKPSTLEELIMIEVDDTDLAAAERAVVESDGVTLARDLVNESAMYKSPEAMADIARGFEEIPSVTVSVWNEDEIEREGLGGLRGVSLGATNPARLVSIRYQPEGATRTLALVGKGIVFDSGGLSIKPAAAMEEMKTDMSGAAAVFGAVQAIARLGLGVNVIGITPLTENMPGGAAVRPGDVLHTRNGKTIEVLNTDAEGRLVLADGLALAVESEPELIVDVATLTGACVVALGKQIAGVFGTDDAVPRVLEASGRAGERMWHLPIPDDYRKLIDSDVADMKNTGGRWGGAITAALLLREFAGDGPWAHLDIAGPARAGESDGHIVKGGTGFGVTTLIELARSMQDPAN